jgi:endoglucanase
MQIKGWQNMKKRLMMWGLFVICCLVMTGKTAAQTEDGSAPPADYRQLPDLHVVYDTPYGQWVGSGNGLEIETGENGRLPVDESETFNDLPSYRVRINGQSGWWSFLLAGKDWESYSIAPYYPDGALEFNIKVVSEGAEDFGILLNDMVVGRNPENLESNEVQISQVLSVTDEWQPVNIPLSAFLSEGAGLNLDQLFSIVFSGTFQSKEAKEMTFWLNDVRFTAPSVEPGYPQIKLNQLGYTPAGQKIAHVSGFDDELYAQVGTPFTVRDISNNQPVYQGELELLTNYDAVVSGERVLAADFTDLQASGRYYLAVEAYEVEDSPLFTIGEDVYQNLVVDGLRYFYLQRSGMPLDPAHAAQFAREAGHLQDAQAEFRSGSQSSKDVSGGWYDAGDYGKYVNAGATAVSDLLWAYELFPEQFPDNHLNIPESGNGVPDLLDEVRWELDWILKMQDLDSGGFYHMVQDTESTTVSAAQEPRFIEDAEGGRENVRPTATTASAVAALAHAATLFESIDPEYASELLAAAEAGWNYLEDNPGGVDPVRGPYSDDDDSDNRFWAATALYRATGNQKYHDYIKDVYQDVETFFESETDNAYGVSRMEMIGWLMYAHSENRDPDVMAYFVSMFEDWSQRMVARWQASNWDIALEDDDFYWSSNYVALTTPFVMLVGSEAMGEMDGTAVVMSQQALDYILGNNPLSFSYVSGYGERSVQHPFSNQWSYDDVVEVPAGVFVGGPNAKTNPLLYSNFAGKRYLDSNANWTTNEHTIYWNSNLVFHAALANQLSQPGSAPAFVEPTPAPTTAAVSQPASQPTAETITTGENDASENPERPTSIEQAPLAPEPVIQVGESNDSALNNLMMILIIVGIVLIVVVVVCTMLILRTLKRNPAQ